MLSELVLTLFYKRDFLVPPAIIDWHFEYGETTKRSRPERQVLHGKNLTKFW